MKTWSLRYAALVGAFVGAGAAALGGLPVYPSAVATVAGVGALLVGAGAAGAAMGFVVAIARNALWVRR